MLQVYVAIVLFAVFVAAINGIIPRKVRYIWLFVCSAAFYFWALLGMPVAVPELFATQGIMGLVRHVAPAFLLLYVTAALCWLFGFLLARAKKTWARVLLLCTGIVFALLPLALRGVLTSIFVQGQYAPPLGAALYSVAALGYIIDVYTSRAKTEKNPVRVMVLINLLCGAFIGPVKRATQLMPQIQNPKKLSYSMFFGGFFRIGWGMFKIMVISDNIAVFTAYVMENPTQQTAPVLVVFLVLFALQITCQLSAISDIAVGAAHMLGFTFEGNFSSPFTARSIGGLFQRWMISVSRVFKDFAELILEAFLPKAKSQKHVVEAILWFFGILGLAFWFDGVGFALWGVGAGLLTAASIIFTPQREKIAAKVPVYRLKPVRAVLSRLWVFIVFCALSLLLVPAFFGQPLGDWIFRFTAGWNTLSGEFLMKRFLRSGFTQLRLIALAVAVVLWLVVEGLAATKQGDTVAEWMRSKWFFVRWPIYAVMILGVVFFGVTGAESGVLLW